MTEYKILDYASKEEYVFDLSVNDKTIEDIENDIRKTILSYKYNAPIVQALQNKCRMFHGMETKPKVAHEKLEIEVDEMIVTYPQLYQIFDFELDDVNNKSNSLARFLGSIDPNSIPTRMVVGDLEIKGYCLLRESSFDVITDHFLSLDQFPVDEVN